DGVNPNTDSLARRSARDAVGGLRRFQPGALVNLLVALALRQPAKLAEPVLEGLAGDRRVVDRPDAAEKIWCRQTAAQRRRANLRRDQLLVGAHRAPRAADQIDVHASSNATGSHGDA